MSIMRERLSVSIKQLPAQAAAAWPSGSERPGLPPPSAFAATCARQLHILSGVLTPLLLPSELHTVFGRIGLMFSRILAEAYELLEPHGAAWEQQLHADVQVRRCTYIRLWAVAPARRHPARLPFTPCACSVCSTACATFPWTARSATATWST